MRSFAVISGENALAQQYTNLRADARSASFLLAQQMLGYFTLSTNPTNTKTLTLDINGANVVFTFVTSIGSTAGNVLIGATAAATVANLLALLQQPQTTTATGVALSAANQTLVSYLSFATPGSSTELVVMSNNTALYAPLTSFSGSTTATSDSFTSQTMQLYVHAGTAYVSGTRVLFTGGRTPTVTAPSSHPRIDVLAMDNTGTLAWTTGTENASPSAPTYPANKVPICELYNVTSETVLVDYDDQASGKGYIYNDVRSVLQPSMNWTAFTSDLIPDADGTRNLGSGTFEWNNIYAKSGIFLNGQSINSSITAALIASESITAGNAVAATLYQATPVGYDTSGIFSRGTTSGSVTIGSNSNRVLTVIVFCANGAAVSGTYNGVSLTFAQTNYTLGGNPYCVAIGYLVAPATGSNTLSISGTSIARILYTSLYNCAQASPLDASASNGANAASSISASATSASDGCVAFGAVYDDGGSSSPSAGTPAGNVYTSNTAQSGTSNDGYAYGNSGVNNQFGAGTAMTISTTGATSSGTVLLAAVMAIKPFNTPVAGVQKASSASVASGNTRCIGFIGFAVSSVSAGQSLTVTTQGVVTGLSTIASGIEYYLNDTNGSIGTTPGTNTRKVGVGLNASQLLITNLW